MILQVSKRYFSTLNRKLPIMNNLKLYYPQGYAKQFKIPYTATTQDVVNLIKREEVEFKNVNIVMGEKDFTSDDMPFLDLILNNPAQIQIDNINYSFDLDLSQSAPYFLNGDLEEEFSRLEIPYFDALVISRFHELFKENLSQTKQAYTPQEIEQAIQRTLTKFAEENATNSQFWATQNAILKNLDLVVAYYQKMVDEIRVEAKKQGHILLKRLIVVALIQYFFLLYLTYGLYDWGVSEPISYLLQQVMETIALFYFIRKGIAFKQSHLFRRKFDETFNKLINNKTNSTQFMKDLEFARRKASLTHARIIYGTTSV